MENEHIMQFFAYEHLPEHLQEVSRPFGSIAQRIVEVHRASSFRIPEVSCE